MSHLAAVATRLRPHRPASLQGRVTLAVLLLVSILLVTLFVAVDLLLGARLRADLRTRLTDRAALAQQIAPSLTSQQLVNQLRGDGVTAQLCTPGQTCVIADPTPAAPVTGSGQTAAPPDHPGGPGSDGKRRPPSHATVQRAGSTLYARTTLADGQQLTLTVDDSTIGSTLSRLIALEVAGGLAALAVAGLLLGRVVGAALRPLDRMTRLARAIAGGDRGRRLGTHRDDTELGRTAVAFDAMLDELETALATARDAEATMRAFLSDASHELRTPLAGLQATAENLLRTNPDRLDREQALAAVVRETARAARLVDDLLTISRGQDGIDLNPQSIRLDQLVAQEVDRYRLLAPQLTWRTYTDSDTPVSADPVRIGQVLTNLLDNARHAAPNGGAVTVTTRRTDTSLEVEVSDTGPGVPAADLQRIFDRLVRLDTSRSRASGGAGLGLSIARAIARAHGGDLMALPGPGGRFRLTLPADPGPHPAAGNYPARRGGSVEGTFQVPTTPAAAATSQRS